eukprot:Hpha_TRINITY_DN27200_c0_g1::TRINITY_DN27200_c0_g1_i1::g.140732::m.140732/K19191/mabO; 4-methylaminobutanoate oxidase (formaldehyde-forming)
MRVLPSAPALRRLARHGSGGSGSNRGLPASADVVIVGGGCIGAAIAHRLALHDSGRSIVLVEREPGLAQATSSWAAGLVGQVRGSADRVRLAMQSVELFSTFQREHEESGGAVPGPGWRQTGSIRVAHTAARVAEFERMRAACVEAGLEVVMETPSEAQRRWPAARFGDSGALACLWCPTDGYLQPADLAATYRHRAQALGVRIVCGTRATGVEKEGDRVTAVQTTSGVCDTPTIINAAGTHAGVFAVASGCVPLPIIPVRHSSYVAPEIDGASADRPVLRLVDRDTYIRADCGRLLLGGFEPTPLARRGESFPSEHVPEQADTPWEELAHFGAAGGELFGERAGEVVSVQQGWPTFVPDGKFIIGEAPELKGFVYAAGCLAHGVSGSAGIAEA